MMYMWTSSFWKATAERAVRMAAGSMVSVLVIGDGVLDAFNADWENTLGVGLGAAVVSVLLSLAGGAVGPGDGPSLIGAEEVVPRT